MIGDPSVVEAVAEGPNVVRREGDGLVIEAQPSGEGWGFSIGDRPEGWSFSRGGLGLRRWFDQRTLTVRMNPRLALEVALQAGSARVRGVTGPIRADVQAGSASIEGFSAPLELSVQAGSVKASGRLDSGSSRIRCDAGSVMLHLEHGSSAKVTARSTLGKVSLPGGGTGRGDREAIIGDGNAVIDIETTMGSVKVSADQ